MTSIVKSNQNLDTSLNFTPPDQGPDPIIFEDDCLSALDKTPSESVDLVITSPPYNIGKVYENRKNLDDYLNWYDKLIPKLKRVLNSRGSICWQTGNFIDQGEVFPLDIYFYPLFKAHGFKLRNRIVWHFGHGLHCSKRLSGRYETILWMTKQDDYIFNLDNIRVPAKYPGKRHFRGKKKGLPSGNPKGKNPSDFWLCMQEEFESGVFEIPNVKANHPEKTTHPCQFPVELVERCILAFSRPKHTILDPFAGVGTTGLAAYRCERSSILIEKDKRYCMEAVRRLEAYKAGLLKVREIGTKIHSPEGKLSKIPLEWKE